MRRKFLTFICVCCLSICLTPAIYAADKMECNREKTVLFTKLPIEDDRILYERAKDNISDIKSMLSSGSAYSLSEESISALPNLNMVNGSIENISTGLPSGYFIGNSTDEILKIVEDGNKTTYYVRATAYATPYTYEDADQGNFCTLRVTMYYDFTVEAESESIYTNISHFTSNWELSSSYGVVIDRQLAQYKVDGVKSDGYAFTDSKVFDYNRYSNTFYPNWPELFYIQYGRKVTEVYAMAQSYVSRGELTEFMKAEFTY